MDEHGLSIQICKIPEEIYAAQDAEMAILEGLGNNILEHLGQVELGRALRIFLRNQANEVVGGVVANCFGGWMYIALLWVEKSLRNRGHGTRLMRLAEAEAIQLGCQNAHVDTYSFETRPFYERLSYELFATLEDYPPGHCKYFLKKRLGDGAPGRPEVLGQG
ncbi:MAG TPA: GNAT family N-acetyltransferase [Anaerolineae bacterium]|nr:GNAT family N-acetyltransferase [Anaerolineae bacterium]HQI84795.1 GNAT family N-acetyltransferase [Anaerolineae bacterium]